MKQLLTIIITLVLSLTFPGVANAALTPEQVAQKAAAVVSGAKGLEATFVLKTGNHTVKGSLKSSGNKFTVSLPQMSSWYNGKALYTYNARTQETTVVEPTAQELLESNPLLYVRGGAGAYICKFSPVKRNGKYVMDLTPRDKKSGITKMTFTVNSTNFHTERIVVTTANGTSTIDVTGLTTGKTLPEATFDYPKDKYPKAEIVDLR